MASAITTSAYPPPPTTNKLDASQRARAMRSSRKLGAVLGTTPFLLESCGSTVPVKLHHASKRDHDSDSHSVLSHLKHHRHGSVFEEDARVSSESLPTLLPSRAYSSSKESLLSASDSSTEESATAPPLMLAVRSKKQPGSKLRPVILLNSTHTSSSSPSSSSDHRVAAAILSPRSASFDVPLTPTTPIEPSRTEVRRRKMARVVRTLGENVPPELVFHHQSESDLSEKTALPESRSSPRKLTNSKSGRRRSASVGSGAQWQRLLDLPAPVFSSSSKAPEDQRWVGAWNRRNIAQVQRELRTLRGR